MSERSVTSALITASLAIALVSLVGLDGDTASSLELAAFIVVPFAGWAVVLSAGVVSRHWMVVGALTMAASTSVLTAMAVGDPGALLAVLAVLGTLALASPRAARLDPGVRSLLAAFGFVALATAWAVSAPARVGETPTWHQIVSHTGTTVRQTIVGVGADGGSVALASLLTWLFAAGVLVGLAIVAGRIQLASLLPASIAVVVIGSWAIERWRGPVAAGSAMWVVAGATVGTAATLTVGPARRAGRSLVLLAVVSLSLGTIHQVRRADGSDLRLILGAIAAAGVGAVIWWASRAVRPRGVNVIAADPTALSTVRTLVSALDIAGSAVREWAIDSGDGNVYDTTVVVGRASGISTTSERHLEVVGRDVRVIGLLTEPAALPSSVEFVDEFWVASRTDRDELAVNGTLRVSVVALPVEPQDGWSQRSDAALLKTTGRNVQRVIGGWTADVGSRCDGDPSE